MLISHIGSLGFTSLRAVSVFFSYPLSIRRYICSTLVRVHWYSIMFSPSSIVSCIFWDLLARVYWNVELMYLYFSSQALYLVCVLMVVAYIFSRCLTVITRKWWSDDTSAPRLIRTYNHDCLNFPLIQMWSIRYCAAWSREVTLWIWQ